MRIFRLPSYELKDAAWIGGVFDSKKFEYNEIPGFVTNDIEPKYAKHYYRLSQLQKLIALLNADILKQSDIIFIDDLNFKLHSLIKELMYYNSTYGYLSDFTQDISADNICKMIFMAEVPYYFNLTNHNFTGVGYLINIWSLQSNIYKSKFFYGKNPKTVFIDGYIGNYGVNLIRTYLQQEFKIITTNSSIATFENVEYRNYSSMERKLVDIATAAVYISFDDTTTNNETILSALAVNTPVLINSSSDRRNIIPENYKITPSLHSIEDIYNKLMSLINNEVDHVNVVITQNNTVDAICDIIKEQENVKFS